MRVEILSVDRCPNHRPAVEMVRAVAAELGVTVHLRETMVGSQADAERLRFLGSPSIRVEGEDVEPGASARTDFALACRTYLSEGRGEGLPLRAWVAAALGGEGQSVAAPGHDARRDEDLQRRGLLALGGSLLGALASSACCWIPLLLLAFGVSAGGVSAWFQRYRMFFLALAAILLGAGFFMVYRRPRSCAAAGSACAAPRPKFLRHNRLTLWIGTVMVIATAAFPKYVGALMPRAAPIETAAVGESFSTMTLGIEGMTCRACATVLENALARVPGVRKASVSYEDGTATLAVSDARTPTDAALAAAIERAGYTPAPAANNGR